MGKTIIEKIFERHTEGPVRPGDVIWLEIDARTARDFGGPNVVKNYEREYDDQPLDDPKKTFFTFDLVAPAKTIKYANNQQICRNFAAKHGIKVYDVGEGIGSHIMIEQGIVKPFSTAVGTDSHYNILGAVGAFGQGMGDVDITFVFRTGKTWFEVPPTVRINIEGHLEPPATAKDLTLYILRKIGTKFALGKAIEFYGPAVEGAEPRRVIGESPAEDDRAHSIEQLDAEHPGLRRVDRLVAEVPRADDGVGSTVCHRGNERGRLGGRMLSVSVEPDDRIVPVFQEIRETGENGSPNPHVEGQVQVCDPVDG